MNTPRPAACSTLTDEQRATFDRDGCLVVRQVVDPIRIRAFRDALANEVETVLNELHAAGEIPDTRPDLPLETRLTVAGTAISRYGRGWTEKLAVRATYDLHQDPGLVGLLHGLLGTPVCGHRQFNVRPKLPHQEMTTVPWHQDTGYYGAHTANDLVITAWLPMVPADEANGCMQVVPGSHRGGGVEHVKANDAGDFLKLVREPEAAAVRTLPMQPGDVLFMHNLCWHRSLPNRTDGIRWSIDLRFFHPATPHAQDLLWGFPAPWVVSGGPVKPFEAWKSWYGWASGK